MSLPQEALRPRGGHSDTTSCGMTGRQEGLELGDLSEQRRVIYFTSGETLEEEEEEEEEEGPAHDETFREPSDGPWRSWRNAGVLVMRMSLHACDFMGQRLAGLLGLDMAKYQYAVDQNHRDRQRSEDLSEAQGERVTLSTGLDRTYSATKPRTIPDSGQGSHNEAYQRDPDH